MRKDDERLAVPTLGGDAFAEALTEVRPLHGVLFVLACLAVAVLAVAQIAAGLL